MLSVIVSVYNEEGNLTELHRQLTKSLADVDEPVEIFLVDDGSTDRSREILRELSNRDPRVVVIHFSRNFGHENAMQAGLDRCSGDRAIFMDADLQHPPHLLPEILQKLKDGYNVVFCIRQRQAAALWRRMTSSLFYKVINWITDIDFLPNASDFFGMDRKVIQSLRRMPEKGRFLRGLVAWSGFRRTFLKYAPMERFSGRSKYSFMHLLELSVDAAISFSGNPLRKIALIGLVISFLSVLYAVFVIFLYISHYEILLPGWATIVVSILFMGGLNLTLLSILGEYLVRTYMEIKGRPSYLIDEIYRSPTSEPVLIGREQAVRG